MRCSQFYTPISKSFITTYDIRATAEACDAMADNNEQSLRHRVKEERGACMNCWPTRVRRQSLKHSSTRAREFRFVHLAGAELQLLYLRHLQMSRKRPRIVKEMTSGVSSSCAICTRSRKRGTIVSLVVAAKLVFVANDFS